MICPSDDNILRFVIPEVPKSLNRYAGRQNHWEWREEKQRWKQMVIRLAPKEKTFSRAVVDITYHFPDKRRRDPDNYSGKMILDGLTAAGVLEDDSFDKIILVLRQGETNKPGYTEVEIKGV